MMKRKILAVMVPAMLVAGAANAAEVYNKDGNKLDITGKIQGSHLFSDDKSADGDKSYVRFGIKGETQVSDQVVGYGFYQAELKADKKEGDNSQKTRLAYAGLKVGDAGSFDYGRNYGVLYDIGGWTDVLPEFGGDSFQQTDVFMTQRAGGLATYRNKNFFGMVDGLNFAVQYQGRNDSGDRNGSDRNGDGWGMSSTYDLGMGLSLGAAYASSDRTDGQTADHRGDRADAATGGIKYDANNIYLAAIYGQTYNMTRFGTDNKFVANKTQNVELVAQYQFDFGLQPSLAWVYSKGKDLGYTDGVHNFDSEELANYIDVGANYYFNKNMSVKVDYKINQLDDNSFTKAAGITTDDVVAVGLVYQF
ncbi:Porin ompk36 [Pragia fontium]|uniref:Outer membrane pore protein F n=3 Tax=Pragia fontium TaxID=82985 RepID=A0AAJ4WC26_9GAMM|nr:phosphoporin PhoE [Pragia fontium]SFD13132.1 outer membrane pore protein F [Pragia fontium DSM 5563 = ATCC 49100]SUB82937.1 Porin ompk36 [Pragia fontium]VEJ55837.1 Porin ompk36 [Pragia fontium]